MTLETSNFVFLKKFLDVLEQSGKAHFPSLDWKEDDSRGGAVAYWLAGTRDGAVALEDGGVGGGGAENKWEEGDKVVSLSYWGNTSW